MATEKLSARPLAFILLILILLIAAGLRFYNLNWDNGIFAHPDERSTVAFYAPTMRWPENTADLFNPRTSPLNPFWDVGNQTRRSYTYGHFPLYTLVLVGNFFYDLAPLAAEWGLPASWVEFFSSSLTGPGFARIGRGLMALADVATVYLIFLLGRRMYGLWGGLLAAALSAFTVLQIQLAHFFAVDTVSTTFTLLAIYGALLLYERRSAGAAVITGLGIGLAVASKFSALPVVFAPLIAAFLVIRHHKQGEAADTRSASGLYSRMFGLLLVTFALAFLVFAVTSPFILLDFDNFYQAVIEEQGNMASGAADMPFTRQYRGTTAYIYFIEQQLRWGMGWPLGLLALAGTVWVIGKALLGRAHPGEWLALAWIVLYFGPTGLFLAKFMRYMVPVVPLFTLFGAGLVVALWNYRKDERRTTNDEQIRTMWATSEAADNETNQGFQPFDYAPFGSAQDRQDRSPNLPTSQPPPPPISQSPNRPISQSPHLPIPKILALTLATVALLGSAFWAVAFVNGVYGTPHSWDTFARWVYANVPDGACIAREHWEEGIPASLGPALNPGARGYAQPELPMYDPDSQQKYELLRNTLMNCDYVALASNRLWRTIPKLPERYPMSTRYYEALFSGELGFEPVYTVETPPRLGPLEIDTQPADESFTVYDHPKPILFKKTRHLTAQEWDAILGNTWQEAIPYYVGEPTLLMRLRGATNFPSLDAPTGEPQDDGKTLLLDQPVDQLPVVDDFRWNSLANSSTVAAIIVWWLAVMLIGLLAFPLTFLLFHKLPDRGYALSKSLGLLLVSYFVWINSSVGLLGNRLSTALIALLLLVGVSGWLIVKQRARLIDFWRTQRRPILLAEALFGLIFLFFVYLRILNPDLWQPWLGGEKMLEIGFLNAVVKSPTMPPYDPFFANGIMNYYYYGLFLVGVLIKLTGIAPAIAFNLAVSTLAALTAINAFSLAGNLALARAPFGLRRNTEQTAQKVAPPIWGTRSIIAGLLGVLFVLVIGNLEGAAQFLRDLGRLSPSSFASAIPGLETTLLALSGLVHLTTGDTGLITYNYWDPTRVIPNTINEFPYFSFLFADLHPHMIGIPFTILFLSLAYNWLRPMTTDDRRPLTDDRHIANDGQTHSQFTIHNSQFTINSFLRWLALPFVLGAIGVINTWDLPTYTGVMLAAFLVGRYRRLPGDLDLKRAVILLLSGLAFAVTLIGVTYLLYAPFFANYQPPSETGLGFVRDKTPLGQHLRIWGFFIFIILSWLLVSLLYPASRNALLRAISLGLRRWNVWPHLNQIYRRVVKRETDGFQMGLWSIAGVLLITLLLFLLGYTVPAYLFPLLMLALGLLFRREISAETATVGLLIFTGLLVLLGVEFVFLRDWLGGGDAYRMNTLFKFFIQVWVMFGIAAAVAVPHLWQWSIRRWSLSSQVVWQGATLVLLLGTLIYPILGTRVRVDDRFPGEGNRPATGSLDGLEYMTVGRFEFEFPYGSRTFNTIQLPYDYEAIRWLQQNVEGTPVIAEAKIGYYREGGMRVAAYTGLPSVLGGLHQNEQRPGSQIAERDILVNEFWNTPDPNRAQQLIDQLNISYIYVGQLERITYGDQVGAKFEQLREQGFLDLVFENEETKIYKVSGTL